MLNPLGFERHPDSTEHWNGHEYYGLAFPQAYASFGSQDFSFQVGHFYSVVGYEGLMAPDNFFYTKSYSYQFAGPFQHWGGQMNWNLNESWTLQLGLVNGWDALDRVSDDLSVIGKIKYANQDTGIWTSFALINGKELTNAAGLDIPNDYANRTRYSWLVGLPLTCRLDYVFHQWLGCKLTAHWMARPPTGTESTSTCTTSSTIAGRLACDSSGSVMKTERASV